jgi:cystathionine beta-lyase family protein involved in aluminum resistance
MSEFSYVVPIIAKLSEKFDSSDYKLINVKGIPQNPSFVISRFEEIIDSFKTRDDDVFVTTFVKAGCGDFISEKFSFSFMCCCMLRQCD